MKYQKAKKLSFCGMYHRTFIEMWTRVTAADLTDRLTAAELAKVIDLMHTQSMAGESRGYQEAREEMGVSA